MAANHGEVVVEPSLLFETDVQGAIQSIVLSPYCLRECWYEEREEEGKALVYRTQVSLAC